jgi:general nucleoside transport system permease protein
MTELLVAVFSATFLAQVVRITVPYALAALGGCVSERSGVINIALEGKLLAGAFGAALGAYYGGGVGWGVAGGVAAGVAVGALYGLCVLRFGADQIVTGVAINLLAYGLTRYLLELQFGQAANSPPTPGFEGHVLANPVLWLAAALLVAVAVILARTPWGLRLRAVGEHPEAAATAGVSVPAVRWTAVLAAGALAGLGGAWLALQSHAFVAEMSGGRGYIALAAVIMGGWRPARAAAACVLFGGAEALQYELQTSAVGLPAELARILPYALTMVVLAGFIGRSRPPAALGKDA